MKVYCIKELCLTNGFNQFGFKKNKVYSMQDSYAKELIKQGYVVEFEFMENLKVFEVHAGEVVK